MPDIEKLLGFGSLLRQYRIAAGLTQEVLAERAGLGVRSIQHLERGENIPHRQTLDRLCHGLGLDGDARQSFEQTARSVSLERSAADGSARTNHANGEPDRPRGHNLPAEVSSFIGRERELAEVRARLAATRLLTLTGVGGSGKTRLALKLAEQVVDEFPDGVWLVDLVQLTDPAQIPHAIAGALGMRAALGRDPRAVLLDALRGQRLLLLLDNCEHIAEGCAQLIDVILPACPEVRILATSREVLAVTGEALWPVPTLPTPDPERLPPDGNALIEAVAATDAVRLFVARAQSASPSFQLTNHNVTAVALICHRLDGMLLAIELAAARLRGHLGRPARRAPRRSLSIVDRRETDGAAPPPDAARASRLELRPPLRARANGLPSARGVQCWLDTRGGRGGVWRGVRCWVSALGGE